MEKDIAERFEALENQATKIVSDINSHLALVRGFLIAAGLFLSIIQGLSVWYFGWIFDNIQELQYFKASIEAINHATR